MCLLQPSPPFTPPCWNQLRAGSICRPANWVNIQIPFIAIEGGCLKSNEDEYICWHIIVFFSNCTQVSLHLIVNARQRLFVKCITVSDESYENWHSWLFLPCRGLHWVSLLSSMDRPCTVFYHLAYTNKSERGFFMCWILYHSQTQEKRALDVTISQRCFPGCGLSQGVE